MDNGALSAVLDNQGCHAQTSEAAIVRRVDSVLIKLKNPRSTARIPLRIRLIQFA